MGARTMRRGRASPRTLIVTVILSMYFCSLSDAITSASINTPLFHGGLHPFIFALACYCCCCCCYYYYYYYHVVERKENDSESVVLSDAKRTEATSRVIQIYFPFERKNETMPNEIPWWKIGCSRGQMRQFERNVPMACELVKLRRLKFHRRRRSVSSPWRRCGPTFVFTNVFLKFSEKFLRTFYL